MTDSSGFGLGGLHKNDQNPPDSSKTMRIALDFHWDFPNLSILGGSGSWTLGNFRGFDPPKKGPNPVRDFAILTLAPPSIFGYPRVSFLIGFHPGRSLGHRFFRIWSGRPPQDPGQGPIDRGVPWCGLCMHKCLHLARIVAVIYKARAMHLANAQTKCISVCICSCTPLNPRGY